MMDDEHQQIGPESAAPRHIPQHDRSPRMPAPDQLDESPAPTHDAPPLAVPRAWVHVPYGPDHVTPDQADANYLRSAAKNIAWSRCLGSNLTATVTALLNGLADQLATVDPAGKHHPDCPALYFTDHPERCQCEFMVALDLAEREAGR